MKLNANQLAFVLDAIDCYEDSGNFTSSDGKYSLTENEVNEVILTFLDEFRSVSNN